MLAFVRFSFTWSFACCGKASSAHAFRTVCCPYVWERKTAMERALQTDTTLQAWLMLNIREEAEAERRNRDGDELCADPASSDTAVVCASRLRWLFSAFSG